MTSVVVSDKDEEGNYRTMFTIHTEGKTLDFVLGDEMNIPSMSPWGLKVSVVSD